MCANKTSWNLCCEFQNVVSLLTWSGQLVPLLLHSNNALQCREKSYLHSAPYVVLYYLGPAACLQSGHCFFDIVQLFFMKTHCICCEPCHGLYYIILKWGHCWCTCPALGLLFALLSYFQMHTVPKGRNSAFYQVSFPLWANLSCTMMHIFLNMLILPVSQVCVSINFSLSSSNSDYHIT